MAKGRQSSARKTAVRVSTAGRSKGAGGAVTAKRSHNQWRKTNTPQPQDDLGQAIIFDYNPYGNGIADVLKLGAGAGFGNDADFWLDCVQTAYYPGTPGSGTVDAPEEWEHREGEAKLEIRKALRIPYVIKDRQQHLTMDHLLVGYAEPTSTAKASVGTWGATTPRSDVGMLGRMIMVQHYPNDPDNAGSAINRTFGTALPAATFEANPDTTTRYVVRPREWKFRGVQRRIEKSLLITYSAVLASGEYAGRILVGYEGGGGW